MSKKEKIQMEDKPCPFGCSPNDEIVLVGNDLLHNLPGEFNVVKCKTCGLMRTNPRPTTESIGFYYPDDYGPYVGTKIKLKSGHCDTGIANLFKSLIKKTVNFNTKPLPNLRPGKMLEIGCASGSFLHEMAEKDWQVTGIEFSPEAAETVSELGYQIHCGPLETAPTPKENYDLIVGWMVLEHLYDPIVGLKKIREWANPNAWLVLSVPNAASLEFKLFKDKWYALQVPTHLYHFTPQTLEKTLNASGWILEKVYHQRVLTNLVVSTGYVLRKKGLVKLGNKLIDFPMHAGKWHYFLYPLSWLLSLFGQTGRMTVHARCKL